MGRATFVPKEIFLNTVSKSKSKLEVARKLSINKGSVTRLCREYEADTSHFICRRLNDDKLRTNTDDDFLEAIKSSRSLKEAALKLGYATNGGQKIKQKLHELKPDVSHFNIMSQAALKSESYVSYTSQYNRLLYFHIKRGYKAEDCITIEEFYNFTMSPCSYCGEVAPPFEERKHGHYRIDRIDSNDGYTVENCAACCVICNRMKMDYSKEDFLNKVKLILAHRQVTVAPSQENVNGEQLSQTDSEIHRGDQEARCCKEGGHTVQVGS